jgi:transposase
MTRVDKIKEVRLLKHVQGLSIREIVKRVRISRNTVRKILRNETTEFTYQRSIVNLPVSGPVIEIVEKWLKEDQLEKKKQRRTAWRMYEILHDEHGYEGSYETIAKVYREISRKLQTEPIEVYIPLTYDPGEAFQFDWGEVEAYIDSKLLKLNIGCVILCHSRFFYPRAYPCQKQELMLDIHRKAFEFFGGVCKRGIYDNLRTAVKRLLKGHHRNLQERFVMFSSHYLYEPQFCSPAKGNEKGRIENTIGLIRRNFFVPVPHFNTIEELNERLLSFAISYCRNREHPDIEGRTRYELYEVEKKVLIQLPGYGFDCCNTRHAVVSPCSIVFYDNNRYSVPAEYVNKGVLVKGYASEIVVSYGGIEIARHDRVYGYKQQVLNPYHYLSVLYRKPGALQNGLPFKNWHLPEVFLQYRKLLNEKYSDDGDKYFARTLILLRDWPIKELTDAVGKAVRIGILGDSYILTLLRHGKDPPNESNNFYINEKLAHYRAEQCSLSEYDKILRKERNTWEIVKEKR